MIRTIVVRGALYVSLLIATLIFLIPIYLMVNTSLKDPAIVNLDNAWAVPRRLYIENYFAVLRDFGPRFRFSLFIAIGATALSSVVGSLNGYVLTKFKLPGRHIAFPLMLFAMFMPYQAILIPLVQFMRSIHLYGGLSGLILIHTVYGIPVTTLIFRNFYAEIPDEIFEAGLIDGSDFWELYRHIVFPLSLPGFVVVIIWQFTQIWNDFLFGFFLTNTTNQPVTVGLAQLVGSEAVKWSAPMAGAVIVGLPPLLVYIVMGRYFVQGLLAGSLRG